MKVLFIDPNGNLPASMIKLGYSPRVNLNLEQDNHYIVYGISIWREVLHYLIIPNEEMLPSWFPADLFDVVDQRLPFEFYFHYFGMNDSTGLSLEIGYKEMVLDPNHSNDLIERKKDAIKIFLKRKIEIDAKS